MDGPEEAERRMQPGAWDTAGFLPPGLALQEILAEDAKAIRRYGLDSNQVGARLAAILDAGLASDLGRPAQVGDHEVEIVRQRGMITCPWAPDEFEACRIGEGARPTANRFRIHHRPSGETIDGFQLSVHLIRDHGFFGGPGTRFRIDPGHLLAALGL
jgi:hypothetical protein